MWLKVRVCSWGMELVWLPFVTKESRADVTSPEFEGQRLAFWVLAKVAKVRRKMRGSIKR